MAKRKVVIKAESETMKLRVTVEMDMHHSEAYDKNKDATRKIDNISDRIVEAAFLPHYNWRYVKID